MTTRFQHCLKVVLKNEGGKVDHKNDRGGRTAYGVTQKTYDEFCKLTGRPQRDVWDIHESEIEAIYSSYWKDAHCSYMPEPLDMLVFDAAVNHGARRAKQMLQRVLGVETDGVIGKDTMRALHEEVVAAGVEMLCDAYLNERAAFFERIVEKDPSQAVFKKGWLARVDHMRTFV